MSIARAIGRNAAYTALGRVSTLLVWFLLTPRVLAALGADRFGLWSILLALAGSIATVDLGLGAAVSRFGGELVAHGRWQGLRRLVGRSILIQAGLLVLLLLPALFLREFFLDRFHVPAELRDEARLAYLLALASIALGTLVNLLSGALLGAQRMDRVAAVSFVAALVLAAAIVWATGQPRPLVALLAVQAGYNLAMVAGLGTSLLALTRGGDDAAAGEDPHVKRVLGLGIWIQATSVFALLQANLDKFLLGALATLPLVGQYEIAMRASYLAYLFPVFLHASLLPAAAAREARLGAGSRVEFHRLALEPFLWLVFVLGAFVVAFAPNVLEAWIGQVAPEGTFMLRMISIAQTMTLATGVASTSARTGDRAGDESAWVALAFALHLALSLIAFRAWGWPGIPLGYAVGTTIAAIWFVARIDRWLGRAPLVEAGGIALRAAGTAAVAGGLGAWAVSSGFGLEPGRVRGLATLAAGSAVFVLTLGLAVVFVFPRLGERLRDELGRVLASGRA